MYNSYFEIRQLWFYRLSYFKTFWNIIDLTSLLLNYIVCILDLTDQNQQDLVVWTAFAVILMWMKLFYFGRIFLKTATTVTMVIEITKDMKYFLVILLIAIAGYGNCYLILSRNYTGEDSFSGETYFLAFIYAYQQAMGDFDTDGFESTDRYYLYALWFLNVIMTLIVLLNLLIAIMGDTFDRVRESLDNNMYKELGKQHSTNI